jgi:hypothetical protein
MMSLSDWEKAGWLVAHKTDRTEIRDLLNLADRDLRECQADGLSPDWRLAIAYNSALQSATAALAAAGYRAVRDQRHYRTIQSLEYTIGADIGLISILDAFRKKRNISDYERSGSISVTEAREMFELAKVLRNTVREWIRKTHPHLVEE